MKKYIIEVTFLGINDTIFYVVFMLSTRIDIKFQLICRRNFNIYFLFLFSSYNSENMNFYN